MSGANKLKHGAKTNQAILRASSYKPGNRANSGNGTNFVNFREP